MSRARVIMMKKSKPVPPVPRFSRGILMSAACAGAGKSTYGHFLRELEQAEQAAATTKKIAKK